MIEFDNSDKIKLKKEERQAVMAGINMKKRIYILVMGLLVFALFLTTALLVNDYYPIKTNEGLTVFLIAQGISLVTLLGVLGYILMRKEERLGFITLSLSTLCLQILPWIIYGFVSGDNPHIILAVVTIFIGVILYVGILITNDLLKNKNKA